MFLAVDFARIVTIQATMTADNFPGSLAFTCPAIEMGFEPQVTEIKISACHGCVFLKVHTKHQIKELKVE